MYDLVNNSKIEVMAEDLDSAHIWMYRSHPDAKGKQKASLQSSRRLRLLVKERFRVFGSKVSTVMKGTSTRSVISLTC